MLLLLIYGKKTTTCLQYGCCIRQVSGNACSNVPQCTLPVRVSTSDFTVNNRCPVVSCPQCLARNSDRLERCEQLHTYLAYADASQDVGLTGQVWSPRQL